ncbi:unnamed protein product [Prunus brigantina]
MGKESPTTFTRNIVIHEAPEERIEQAPKQDEAGKLLKELAGKFPRPGKAPEQVELPQNKKTEAANTNGTNEKLAAIRGNEVTAKRSHHAGVFDCNKRAQGTGCNIVDNKELAKRLVCLFVSVLLLAVKTHSNRLRLYNV